MVHDFLKKICISYLDNAHLQIIVKTEISRIETLFQQTDSKRFKRTTMFNEFFEILRKVTGLRFVDSDVRIREFDISFKHRIPSTTNQRNLFKLR